MIAAVDGELTCKCLGTIDDQPYLLSGNELFQPIYLTGKEVHIWGIVIHTIHYENERCMIGLIDCNNFYVSCERVFNPKLEGKPIGILSTNNS
ncbi:hypothetical protein A9G24_01565 [Gilliamella sp. App6-5]|nr:hypothetical protein A9G24_01565 [Gilliamella apicola]